MNRVTKLSINRSPWEVIHGEKPDLLHLRVFGVLGYSHISREARQKLAPVSHAVRFLGYVENEEEYFLQVLEKSQVVVPSVSMLLDA